MQAKQCLKVELTIPQIETIISALHLQNIHINRHIEICSNGDKDIEKQIKSESVSNQLETEFLELLQAIKEGVIL